MTLHGGVVVKFNDIGGFREADLCGNGRTDFHTETQRLVSNVVHHVVGINAFRIAREVLDFGGGGQLPARLDSFIKDGRQARTTGIDGCGISGRTGAENETFNGFHCICCFLCE